MTASSLLIGLALGVVLVLLVPVLVLRLAARFAQRKDPDRRPAFCTWLCRIRVALAFLLGLAIGALIFACRDVLLSVFRDRAPCIAVLFLIVLLALAAAIVLVLRVLECGAALGDLPSVTPGHAKPGTAAGSGFWSISPYLLILLLAILVFVLLLRAGGGTTALIFGSLCGKLLLIVILVAILFLVVRGLELRLCIGPTPDPCCGQDIRTWLLVLLILLLAALLAVRLCDGNLRDKDFDLAMVGIFWDGKYAGERGVHLRWAFRYGLPFPQQGFDLYRRAPGGGWSLLNTDGRMYPIRTWSGPVSGPAVWRPRGIDRLPAVVHPRFEGANTGNADLLIEMTGRSPYQPVYYVEGRDLPFATQADADAFAAGFTDPLAQWQMEPMTLLMTLALHAEVARLLGLYYVDLTADPALEYDYRVVGYWNDRTRSYTTPAVSLARTGTVPPPVMEKAVPLVEPARDLPDGTVWPTEASVALRWNPPTATPDLALTQADGIRAVFFVPERQDIGPIDAPGMPDPGSYQVLPVPDDSGGWQAIDPIVVSPEEVTGGPDRWPTYFGRDRFVQYRAYAYRVMGIDIFGRSTTPSNYLVALVTDQMPPPAPANIEAHLYQRSDPARAQLVSTLRNALFPPNTNHEYALQISWLWPHSVRRRVPDVKEFRIHYKFTSYASFATPANAGAWRDVTLWEGTLATEVPASGQPSLPSRYEDPANPGTFTVPPSDYFEVIITNLPASAVASINADDNRPVAYGGVTVASVDHDPFNNVGPAGPPVIVVARDFIPPNPPTAPELVGQGTPKDGYVPVTLHVTGADSRYRYQFIRVRDRALITPPAPAGTLPASCTQDPNPTVFLLQRRAYHNPDRYLTATPVPLSAEATGGPGFRSRFTDEVDAAVSQRFLYAARAIDSAGNVSDPSCPSLDVLTRDGMPPRAPVLTSVRGGEGQVSLSWSANEEQDLDHYEIYRSAEQERLNSKRKMTLVLAASASGSAVTPTPSAPDAVMVSVSGDNRFDWADAGLPGGKTFYYRLVAVDLAGNASEMSDIVSGRPVDETPPPAPTWAAVDPVVWATGPSAPPVRLSWQPLTNEPQTVIQVQRQEVGGSPAWASVSGWVDGTTWDDNTARAGSSYRYRLRAMDPLGNRGAWSAVRATP